MDNGIHGIDFEHEIFYAVQQSSLATNVVSEGPYC
jgi:hypothetical protein